MTPMLARPATVAQATFEPEEDDLDEEDSGDGELLTFSPDFLPPVPDLSPDDEEEDESELAAAPSAFLPSDPFDEAAAGSVLFWLLRLSVR